uniref:Uncharacterized protein n=1 Tax=Alexandrium monilatum TaxID=311494 RepID=A0A7S4Q8E8_9DINO
MHTCKPFPLGARAALGQRALPQPPAAGAAAAALAVRLASKGLGLSGQGAVDAPSASQVVGRRIDDPAAPDEVDLWELRPYVLVALLLERCRAWALPPRRHVAVAGVDL